MASNARIKKQQTLSKAKAWVKRISVSMRLGSYSVHCKQKIQAKQIK